MHLLPHTGGGAATTLSFLCLPFAPAAPCKDIFLNLKYQRCGQPARPKDLCCDKPHDNLGRKGCSSASVVQSQAIMKGSHGRNQEAGTEAEARAGVSAASWLAHYGLHSLLSESARGLAPPTVSWTLWRINPQTRQ